MKKFLLNLVIAFAIIVTIFFTYSAVKAIQESRKSFDLMRGE